MYVFLALIIHTCSGVEISQKSYRKLVQKVRIYKSLFRRYSGGMKLEIIGSGEAFDEGLGNNSCLLSGASIPTILFDCGYQIPERLWKRKLDRKLEAVYISHIHGDHCFGIIPLLARMVLDGRKQAFTIISHMGMSAHIKKLFQLSYPGLLEKKKFSLNFIALLPGKTKSWKSLTLHCTKSKHQVLNLSVRVELPTGKSFAFSGDGMVDKNTSDLYEGVDLLVHEVFTLRKYFHGHSSLTQLLSFLSNRNIQRIVLTHHAKEEKHKIRKAVRKMNGTKPSWMLGEPGKAFRI